ncbi:MAG: zonular occludens toxin domain-containing protein [Azonexus sp.]|jgi:hypothetical protein|nr:zonular occludens toxin domain-containing protein [Azonexus sp.]
MIILTTGVPGSGKTLYTLHQVKTRIEAENAKAEAEGKPPREIYYSGINDLKLPWIELEDPTQWNTLPPGSVIVIDECQRVFRPRGSGATVPPYIADLETHRHKGYDIYLITQHPMLCDQNIRRLVGKHQHIVRKFGISAATVHEWGSAHEITQRNLLAAVRTTWPYSKEVFGYYKSAELHTHKAKLPKRVFFLLASPLLIGLFAWLAWSRLNHIGPKPQAAPAASDSPAQQAKTLSPAEQKVAYFQAAVPRIPGLYHTAPKYDELTQPTDAPFPSACMITAGFDHETGKNFEKCGCIDQQGNRYKTDMATCKNIAINGYFKDWGQQQQAANTRPEDHRPPQSTHPEPKLGDREPSGESSSGSSLSSYGPVTTDRTRPGERLPLAKNQRGYGGA